MIYTKRKKGLLSRIVHTIIAAAIGITSVFSAMPKIEAEAFYETYISGSGTYAVWQFWGVTNNGASAFCIEPQIHADLNGNYVANNNYMGLTDLQKRYMAMAQYYGYPNVSTTNAYYVATQAIIWEIALGMRNLEDYSTTNNSIYFTLKNAGSSLQWVASNYYGGLAAYNNIINSMHSYGVKPSIGNLSGVSNLTNYTLSYDVSSGKYTRTLTDTRGQLSKFNIAAAINANAGWSARISGNDLIVTATEDAADTIKVSASTPLSFASTSYNNSLVTYYNPYNPNGFQKLVTGCRFDPVSFQLQLDKKVGNMEIDKTFLGADGKELKNSELTSADKTDVTFRLYYIDGSEYPVKLTTNSTGDYTYKSMSSSGTPDAIKLNTSTLKATIKNLPSGQYRVKESACSASFTVDDDSIITVKNDSTTKVPMSNTHNNPTYKTVRFKKNWVPTTDKYTDEEAALINKNHQILNSQVFFLVAIDYTYNGINYTRYLADANYTGTETSGNMIYSVYDANCASSSTGDADQSKLKDSAMDASYLAISYARDGIVIKNLPSTTTKVTFKEEIVGPFGSKSLNQVIQRINRSSSSVTLSDSYSYGTMSENASTAQKNAFINHFIPEGNVAGDENYAEAVFGSYKARSTTLNNIEKHLKLGFGKLSPTGGQVKGGKFMLYMKQGDEYVPLLDEPFPANTGGPYNYGLIEGEYPVGEEYYIKELEAPEGYYFNGDEDKYYKIDKLIAPRDDKYEITMIAELPLVTTFSTNITNLQVFGKVKLYKEDDRGNPIKGVKFNLYSGDKAEGTPVEVLETNENGYAESSDRLELGTYTLKEASTVSPYYIDESEQTFTFEESDPTVFNSGLPFYWRIKTIYAYNFPVDLEVNILKTDTDKVPLDNAEFTLSYNKDFTDYYGNAHKAGEVVCVLTTDENGKATTNPQQSYQGEEVDQYQLFFGAEYRLHETKAPEGYVAESSSDDIISFTYPESFKTELSTTKITKSYTKVNELQKGDIEVEKHSEGDLNIANIEFILSGTSTAGVEINQKATTDKNGKCEFNDIPVGEYVISENEKTVPIAYLKAASQKVTVEYNKTAKASFFNLEKRGSIEVTKRTEGNLNVSGIKFNLSGTSDSGREITQSATTDANGQADFTNIPIGTYTIAEDGSTVPAAYLIAKEQSVTVKYNQTTKPEFYNDEKKGSVEVTKRTEGNKNVANIKFLLSGTSDSGRKISLEAVTDKTGKADFSNVPIGKYVITEDASTVPFAYLTAEKQSVTVEYAKTSAASFFNDEKKGSINVKKRTEGNLNVANIKFTLSGTSDSGREISKEAITDKNGNADFENIPIGTYIIKEDAATVPFAYLTAAEQSVIVEYAKTTEKEFFNEEKAGSIEVTKRTEENKNIANIKFILSGTSDSGRAITLEAITNENGKADFSNVPIGKYVITEDETTVPFAYLTAEKQSVNVTYAKTAKTEFFNKEKEGTIYIHKRTEGDLNVANIKFTLAGTSDSGREISISSVTDETGKADFKNIPIGTYTIYEEGETVPFAYLTASPKSVVIDYLSENDDEFFNDEKKGDIEITKRTEGNKNVANVKFNLSGTSTSGRKITLSAVTDKNGKAYFDDVPIGTYTISEDASTVNAAYLVADSQSVEVIYNEIAKAEFFNKEKEGSVEVTKRSENDKNVANIKFILTGTSESGREIFIEAVTDENGKADFKNVPIGSYEISEDAKTVPFAYLTAEKQNVTVKYAETSKAEFFNKEKKGNIEVTKRTEEDINVANIKFILSGTSDSGDAIKGEAVTDGNGKAEFKNLPIGTYTITEDGATVPAAYLVADKQEVTVTYNKTTKAEFFNKEKEGSIKVVKRTEENKNVANIDFTLTGTSETGRAITMKATTDENGNADFLNVPIGSYVITEDANTVPFAYLTAEKQAVTVKYAEVTNTEFYNKEKEGSIEVFKRTEGNKNIANIRFILSGTSDSGRAISKEAVTDENGKAGFTNIPIGKYTIAEDGATVPTAYLTAEKQGVTVAYEKTTSAEFYNQEKEGSIEVYKRTEEDKNIANIKFILSGVSETGREITREAVTDENGKADFANIPIGTYTIVEDAATVPTAYLTADEQSVTVKYAETAKSDFFNEEKEGTIEVTKRSEEDKNVANIKFILTGTSDSGREITREAVTDENGKANFENIPIGTYIIKEDSSSVISAYLVADEQSVSVTYAETSNVNFFNDEKKGTIEVKKRTEGDLNLEGIRFILTGTSESGRTIEYSAVTDAEGKAEFENVPIGTYLITEDGETTPYAYLTAEPQEVSVFYAETSNVEFFNDEKTGTIQLQKRTEGDLNLEGIEFVLTGISDSGREITVSATTDAEGFATFENIPIGTYTITENGETTPYAYLTAEAKEVSVYYAQTTDIEFFNDEKTGTIQLQKRTEGDLNLEGIEFALTGISDSGREITVSATTDAEGFATFENIPIGTYTITENGETTPYAYLTAEPQEVSVFYAQTTDIEFFNDEKTGTIEIKKHTEGEKNLGNIRFILSGTSDGGREILMTAVTDEAGEATFENVPIGTYIITEDGETVPYGYLVADEQEVTVSYAETSNVKFENDTTKVEFSKKSITGEDELEGAKLQIIDKDGNVIEEWVSGKTAHLIEGKLKAGETYKLHEEISPDGYVVANDVEFTVNKDGKLQTVEMKDDTTKVEFSKKSITGKDELEGAKLQVIDKDGKIIDEWVSGKTAHLIEGKLKAGKTYRLHEVISPDGYVVANDVEFTVNKDGKLQTVEMKDDTTKVRISKRDMTTDKELAGAKLQIIDENGNVVEEWISTTTPHYVEGKLVAGKEYTLREITAPNGYEVANDVEFTVNSDGTITEVVMKDTAIKVPATTVPSTGSETGTPISIVTMLLTAVVLICIRKSSKSK